MKILRKLPGTRREPPGLELTVLRKVPMALLIGTVLPAVYALAARLFVTGDNAVEIARQVQMYDYVAIGLVIFIWSVVITVTIFCVIVWIMKGPAYVADPYELPDRPTPKD